MFFQFWLNWENILKSNICSFYVHLFPLFFQIIKEFLTWHCFLMVLVGWMKLIYESKNDTYLFLPPTGGNWLLFWFCLEYKARGLLFGLLNYALWWNFFLFILFFLCMLKSVNDDTDKKINCADYVLVLILNIFLFLL